MEVDNIDPACNRAVSCSTAVRPAPVPIEDFDSYGNIHFNDEKARLDNFAIQLQHMPGFTGYIVGYGTCNAEGVKRANRAKNYLVATRGLNVNRIVVNDGGCLAQLQVKLWVLPPDIKPPTDESGIISPCPKCKNRPPGRRRKYSAT
ncbi:MAG TPA: hypothetical protein VE863_14950 [Pyrinomonadaceae bacterium]|nr:hypothetical protein [Pyrinomonadaceae bacterium]